MLVNHVKSRLQAGETVYGCFVRYPDPALVELIGYMGWDFLVFDGEHSTMEPSDCEALTRAAELRGVTSIMRVPANAPATILRFMDTGVQGLHVPGIETGAEAEAAVRSVKYHPRGNRGLAGVRAANYSQAGPLSDYVAQANAQTLVVLHIESAQAVAALPDILAVADVDVAFIGPTDLSHSLGLPGQIDHPQVQAVIQQAVEQITASPAALGIMVGSAEAARAWQARGARYIATGLEAILGAATRSYLQTVRAA